MDQETKHRIVKTGTEIAKKAAYGTMTGGVGHGARKGAEQAYKSGAASAARRLANRYHNKKAGQQADKKENKDEEKAKKMTGPLFWIVMTLAIIKDLSDIVGDLSVILSIFTIITGAAIYFIIVFYLFYERVSFDTRKVVTLVISGVISIVPFLNLIPETAISLLITRVFENSPALKAVANNKLTSKIAKVV